jgi:hypothetical protein
MTNLNPGDRKFLLLLLFWMLILPACTKSVEQTAANRQNPASPPVKSWVVTYPFYTPQEVLFYNFQHDSVANTITVSMLDSMTVYEGTYARIWTSKIYYLTATKPRRVAKISVRRTSQPSQYASVQTQNSYDFEYQYNDDGYIPSHTTITVYADVAGMVIKDREDHDVYNPIINWSYEGGFGDPLNWNDSLPQRRSLKEVQAGCCFLRQFTDSSFELTNNSNDYSFSLFYNFQDQVPSTQLTNGDEQGIYIFNKDHLLSTMAMDIVGAHEDPPTGPIPTFRFWGYYQRKFDYTYLSQQPGAYSMFNVTGIPEAIYWEQVCQYVTGIYGMYAYPRVDSYNTIDPYIVDLHQYYQDICDSYTDSLFTADDSDNKVLVSQDKYFNTVVMNGDTVSRIVKTDEAGHIVRNIELKY